MKTEQEQIEEMRKIVYKTMHSIRGIASATDIATALVQAGYGDVSEYKAEIERLEKENTALAIIVQKADKEIEELRGQNIALQKNYDTLLQTNTRYYKKLEKQCAKTIKQAKIDVLNKVKEKVYPFLQAEMYNKKHFIAGDSVNDKLRENQNIGILIAQDVLSKWFKVKIDELIKEIEK